MTSSPTPMERAILQLVAEHHWPGFIVDRLEVTRREHTGVGRYVHFLDHGEQPLVDGAYGVDARFIEMAGIPGGLHFEVVVVSSRLSYLELSTSGGEAWDGAERAWTLPQD